MGVFLVMAACALPAGAQFLRTSYFMEGTHYRQQLNPALAPTKGFISLPIVGGINATVGSTSLGYQDILDIIDNGDEFYKSQDFMNRLKDNNTLNMNLNLNILSAGWYSGKNFWNFTVGVRTDIGATVTKSLFSFLNEVDGFEENWRTSAYDISGQQLNVQAYGEVGLGLSRQINDRLTVGGKVKVLLGMGNMALKFNRVAMSANLPSDERIAQLQDQDWLMSQDLNSLKNEIGSYHANVGINAELQSSFKGLELVESSDGQYIDDFDFDAGQMGIAGMGFGIDLGASYKVLDNLTVSAAVLDLGFINWKKDATQIATATSSSELNFEGSKYTNMIDVNKPQSVVTAANALQSDAQTYIDRIGGGDVLDFDMLQLQANDAEKSRKSRLAATLVLGGEYGFFDNKLAVGVLSTTRFLEPKAVSELTFSANYRPKSWFNVALSYSAIQSAGKSFGAALKVGSFFIGTDYMFLGKNSNSVNGFLGVSIPLGGKKI